MSILDKIDNYINESYNKILIVYRLKDGFNNKTTLSVLLRPDSSLSYVYYNGWQSDGMPNAISNLQMKKSLPISIKKFNNISALDKEVTAAIESGVESIIKRDIINKNLEVPSVFGKNMSVDYAIKMLKTLAPNQIVSITIIK